MNNIWILLKIQLQSFFGINKALNSKDPKERRKFIRFCILAVLSIPFFGLASASYTFGMLTAFTGGSDVYIPLTIMMASSSFIVLFTSIFKTNGLLFGYKDYDTLMSLPVKTDYVIASRILMLYVFNMFFILIIMVPTAIVYGIVVSPGLMFYLIFVITLPFIPLVPIIIATLIGVVITVISSGFRYKNIANIIVSIAFLLGIMYFSSSSGSSAENMANAGKVINDSIYSLYPFAMLYTKAMAESNIVSMLLFIAVSSAAFVLFAVILAKKYKAVNTALTSVRSKSNYKMVALKQESPFSALYVKEIKRYFASAVYVMNTGIGVILVTAMTFAIIFFGSETLEQVLEIPSFAQLLNEISPLIISAFVVLCCTTASSISLEGKTLWLVQSLPVTTRRIFLSKIALNLTIIIPATLINCVILAFILGTSPFETFLLILTPIVYGVFTSVMGLIVNLKFPNLEWVSETTVVKQSASAFIAMLIGLASIAAPIFFAVVFSGISKNLIVVASTIVLGALSLVIWYYLSTWGEKVFRSL